MNRALIVVDVQPTFCEHGELPVVGGDEVAQAISDHLDQEHYDLVVTTQDWHVDPGEHFSAAPDYLDSWPPHGVAGTVGAELHPALGHLVGREGVVHVRKGQHCAAYSGFEGHDEQGRSLAELLELHQVGEVLVVGIATSHCVRATALDARSLGYATTVLSGVCVGVTPELAQRALEELGSRGVTIHPDTKEY